MGKINAAWHERHKMPESPTEMQRAAWHYGHAINCGCRTVTPTILELLKTYGYTLPLDAPGAVGRDEAR